MYRGRSARQRSTFPTAADSFSVVTTMLMPLLVFLRRPPQRTRFSGAIFGHVHINHSLALGAFCQLAGVGAAGGACAGQGRHWAMFQFCAPGPCIVAPCASELDPKVAAVS